MYRRVEIAIAAGLMILGIATIVGAAVTISVSTNAITADPVGPRGFAYAVGVILTILGAVELRSLLRRSAELRSPEVLAAGDPAITGDDPRYPASTWRAFAVVMLTLLYAVVLAPLGYILATAMHITACMWTMGSRRRSLLIVFPVVYAISTYLLFHNVLGVRVPNGPLDGVLTALKID